MNMLLSDMLVLLGAFGVCLFIGYCVGFIEGERYAEKRYFDRPPEWRWIKPDASQTFPVDQQKGDINPWPTKKS